LVSLCWQRIASARFRDGNAKLFYKVPHASWEVVAKRIRPATPSSSEDWMAERRA
jgi:hypothetical protein